jgi:diguanylate cyclase (GGDEF)-like protein/PAS domain S-box-containing protein
VTSRNRHSIDSKVDIASQPLSAASTLLLAETLMIAAAGAWLLYLLYGIASPIVWAGWWVISVILASTATGFLYFHATSNKRLKIQNLSTGWMLYRFIQGTLWTAPHFLSLSSKDPSLHLMPAFLTGLILIFTAFINLSLKRYIAGAIPQLVALLYVTQQLPDYTEHYAFLTGIVSIGLIPASYALEKTFRDYVNASAREQQYRQASATAERHIEDISQALGNSQKQLQLVADNTHDVIALHNTTGHLLFVSKAIQNITGHHASALIGQPPSQFIYADDYRRLRKLYLQENNEQFFKLPLRYRVISKNGALTWVETITRPVKSQDDGEDIAMVSSTRDISSQITLEESLQKQARLDPLTGCANRKAFDEQLSSLVSSAHNEQQSHALIYIDLDQFKIINDSCGHLAGDALLIEFSKRLLALADSNIHVARLGGDEFGILLEGVGTNAATRFANTARGALARQDFEYQQQFFSMAASFGIAIIDQHVKSAEEALGRADVACYVAKASGRNGIHLWLDGDRMVNSHTEAVRLATEVKQAMDQQRVHCFGQMVVALDQKRPAAAHCEVLTAIQQSDGEYLAPAKYLPALERFGLCTDYDHYVVEKTLATLQQTNNSHAKGWGWISINLSAQTVCNPPSLEIITALFQRYNVSPKHICFEITETAKLESVPSALTFLNGLHNMGCMLALDDFGSGHSSFEHLLKLPFDIVKIDGQFIADLPSNPASQSIVESICKLAKQLDILTVAEMVENLGTAQAAFKLGVNYGQGFYLANRQPLATLLSTHAEELRPESNVLRMFTKPPAQ